MADLAVEIRENIESSLANHSMGVDTDFGFNFGVMGNAQGEPQVISIVVIRMASMVHGEWHTTGFFLPTPAPHPAELDQAVKEIVKGLWDARMKHAQSILQSAQTGENGSRLPKSFDLTQGLPKP